MNLLSQSKTPLKCKARLRTIAVILTAAAMVGGCSPAAPETEVRLSIGAPDRDPGRLMEEPIQPPYLTDLRDGSAQPVAMRLGEDPGTVQTKIPVEIVPTPDPDGASKGPEIIPTPPGKPSGKTVSSAKSVSSEKAVDDVGFPEGVDGPEDYRTWKDPALALVVTGQQHGYVEPCGCTGLDRQKGGVARRFTFLRQLRDKGWPVLPMDAGNQVRRFGRQPEVKLQQTVRALQAMDYQAVGFGPDDIRLGVGELLAVAAGDTAEDTMYVSANVVLIDPSLMPQSKVIQRGGIKVGITSVLDPESLEVAAQSEIAVEPMVESTQKAMDELNAGQADFKVLMFFGSEESAHQLVREVPGFDLLVVAGGYGEPTYRAEPIDQSDTVMVVTGSKGMYAGLIGLYPDQPLKYARVALTHEFEDAPEMRQLMKDYQDQLKQLGLRGLGLLPPIPHSSGYKFVGSTKCGECHTTAFDIWQGTPHAEATEHIVRPPEERGDVARHFDPECISCHVTGWHPQDFYPYASGYLSLEESEHLTGSGCENCHGPGSDHVAAEEDATVAAELREQFRTAMRLPLEKARETCLECHDLDNSPDFHEEDAFEDVYWPEVEHYGLD